MTDISDIFVVGGGINGVGIARDAAGRGLKVTLAEKDDLAAHTSSASSKLIHGGLRYLEQYEFRLVRESLHEREVLLKTAPHLVHPRRFLLPHHSAMRPAWMLRLGLFLYDHIGGRRHLPPTRSINLRRDPGPLQNLFKKGFEYSDCWVDDARLVVTAAMDAAERGATILKGYEVMGADWADGLWQIEVKGPDGTMRHHQARALVNAGGPWVNIFRSRLAPQQHMRHKVRLVKGSHIVVPALYEGEEAYTLQNRDGRVVFAIPYLGRFTLIGTTDVAHMGDPADVKITEDETIYLCEVISAYFKKTVTPADVVWSFSGVRPLADDGAANVSKTTRDYVLDLDIEADAAPLLSVYGGKLTTFRRLAEEAMEKLQPVLGFEAGEWTAHAPLPGGDMPGHDFPAFLTAFKARHPWLPADMADRLAVAYGTRAETVIGAARNLTDLGRNLGDGLYEAEVDYLRTHEWATSAEDILWRRSKLGLFMAKAEQEAVAAYLAG
ncbi:glycerol-3-phosphate dehydrogenase [Kordiimonas marina]|uniref:glycerol-3-phosphate dehydrogenase n=1 Tax=Kordiimonas marina TaxID=2872312 RepID=UPI001FF3A71B|nr:glycerol-3-phosphate dehydrogenase [Kordiimonas marina]MCJ9427989.1 glycerol-3-phosphate dehydrogenase [Kordiimonas marina]